MLAPDDKQAADELEALWPIKRFPVLVDEGRTVVEASIIIEHLGLHHPGPVRLIPEDAREAPEVRRMDRIFDNYVMTSMMKNVFVALRTPEDRDNRGVDEPQARLTTAYSWLVRVVAARDWAAGAPFSWAGTI